MAPDAGAYYYFIHPSSLTNNLFSGKGTWLKRCFDLKSTHELVRTIAQKCFFSGKDLQRLEKRLLANFTWYTPQILKLGEAEKGAYFAALLETANQGLAVHTMGPEGFEVLCQSAAQAGKSNKRPSKIRHIALVTWGLRSGGAERVAGLLAELLQGAGFKVTFFADEPRTQEDYPHTAERVILNHEPAERWNQIQAYCRSLRVDLCLFTDHYNQRMLYDLLAAKLAGCLVIPWEHSFFFFPLYTGQADLIHWRDKAYRAADAIACLSDTYADLWKAAGHKHAVGLPNPLTFERNRCQRATGQEKNIIFIGRLCELKGAKAALRVLADLRLAVPEARMIFLGRFESTAYEAECRALARELNITEHISFEGHVADISAHLARAAAHIMPSQCEGSPMALMEAKAHGVPSVLFEMKYLELASEEYGCVMVGKNDCAGMTSALARLLQDHEYWRLMSDRAYDSLAIIDNQEVLRRWQELFTNLEKGEAAGGSNEPAYMNEPALLLEVAMRETTCALSHIYAPEPTLKQYLTKIQYMLETLLPAHSRRRHYAKALAKSIWYKLETFKHIRRQSLADILLPVYSRRRHYAKVSAEKLDKALKILKIK
jgi:glycosyltransferase involved in cell wall biosynthesis